MNLEYLDEAPNLPKNKPGMRGRPISGEGTRTILEFIQSGKPACVIRFESRDRKTTFCNCARQIVRRKKLPVVIKQLGSEIYLVRTD